MSELQQLFTWQEVRILKALVNRELNKLNEEFAMKQILDDTPYQDYNNSRYMKQLKSILEKI